jgi:hypothetical protein
MIRCNSQTNLHDSNRDDIFMVVGYESIYTGFKQLNIYGIYKTNFSANQRISDLTGNKDEENFRRGKGYCLWINKMRMGDCKRMPNAGAFE